MSNNDSFTVLPDRSVLRITGPDAEQFLQGLVTNDITKIGISHQSAADQSESSNLARAIFSGLLTPQGKILFDFFAMRTNDSFLLDVASHISEDLTKRLRFYKLRAHVEIENISDDLKIAYISADHLSPSYHAYTDPRLSNGHLGLRGFVSKDDITQLLTHYSQIQADEYKRLRINFGIPEGGIDYIYGNTFPFEACYDLLNGVDYQKGCYVGQEVVSRMHHRGTVRKRIVKTTSQTPLTEATGADVMAGNHVIGRFGSSHETQGLALVRLDRAAEALANKVPITVAEQEVVLSIPDWADYSFET